MQWMFQSKLLTTLYSLLLSRIFPSVPPKFILALFVLEKQYTLQPILQLNECLFHNPAIPLLTYISKMILHMHATVDVKDIHSCIIPFRKHWKGPSCLLKFKTVLTFVEKVRVVDLIEA